MASRMPPAWAERLLDNLLGPVGQSGPLTCRLVTGTPQTGKRGPVTPMDASYESGYRDGENSRTADFLLGFHEAGTMDDLLAYFRSLTDNPALEWPDGNGQTGKAATGEAVQTAEDAQFAEDLARAVGEERARTAARSPEPDLARDMNDWRG